MVDHLLVKIGHTQRGRTMFIYCEMRTAGGGGGCTVWQKRIHGLVDFYFY